MDSIQSLINKLAVAANGGEDNMALLEIVEEIKTALLAKTSVATTSDLGTSSVSVMLPQGFKIKATQPVSKITEVDASKLSAPRPPSVITATPEPIVPIAEPEILVEPVVSFVAEVSVEVPETPLKIDEPAPTAEIPKIKPVIDIHSPWMPALPVEETLELPITDEMVHEAVALENLAKKPVAVVEEPEAVMEQPVVVEKAAPKDLNQKLAQRSKVLNEVFSQKEPVLAETLSGPRITDLRKAISINEKYQYIDTLFRGDEQMFERSIKTLNNFDILPEAQYWMQRELLIKLGWNDEDELVQRFFSLVSRRFS